MTITEKILARKAGRNNVAPGDIVICEVDLACVDEIQYPIFIGPFDRLGGRVWDRDKAVAIIDHHLPASSIDAAETNRLLREFAARHRLTNAIFDDGIKHHVFRDRGMVRPGMLVVATDSHTNTGGAFSAFAVALGPTDVAAVFREGRTWFRVPETIKVELEGVPCTRVSAKDIALSLLSHFGADFARYKSIEFGGSTLPHLDIDGRMTLCNMTTELGAKNGIFPTDEIIDRYAAATGFPYERHSSDSDAEYAVVHRVDVAALEPLVAAPFSPSNVEPVYAFKGQKVNQAFVGSCTNGNLTDIEAAASILRGRKVHPGVRLIVIPASKGVFLEAARRGLVEELLLSGANICTPNCGPCGGTHMGVLGAGEVMISSQNRNFKGRAGHIDARVFLASPETVAAAAVAGEIVDPRDI